MKRTATFFFALSLLFSPAPLLAADTWHELSAANALKSPMGQDKLLPDIKVYLKGQPHPGVAREFGEFATNQRSNAFGKPAETACNTAFLSAVIALQKRAVREGGNAVIDIYSITRDEKFESAEKFRCIAGMIISNVALKGTVVTLR